jgi:hypothetical protein
VAVSGKPTVEDLGVDVTAQTWQRSGDRDDAFEVAFIEALHQRWVLTRVAAEPSGLVQVYSRHEWECFLDGAKRGEFDDATA